MKVAVITTFAHKAFEARRDLLTEIKKSGFEIVIMGPENKKMCESLSKKYNIDYEHLAIKRNNLNPFKEFLSINDIKKKLKCHQIDCVLVYGIRLIPSVVLAAKVSKVKRIVCIINGTGKLLMLSGIKGFIARLMSFPMLKFAFNKANTVFFQNSDDYNEFKTKGLLLKNNIEFTNGSGVNINYYNKWPLPKNNNFLMISRIIGSKGVNEYINAAIVVKKLYPKSQFHLVGPKDDDESIDWNLLNYAVKNNILVYHGESDDVRSHLRNSRIYVFPSFYREGVPRSVLEAMAVGRPIITTDSPGCRETVVNGINGFLIPPKNVNILVKKIIWMIENPLEVEKMAKESRLLVLKKFDVNNVNKKILQKLLDV